MRSLLNNLLKVFLGICILLVLFFFVEIGEIKIPAGLELFNDLDSLKGHIDTNGAAATLATMEKLESELDIFGQCHNRAHDIGIYLYEKYGENAFEKCTERCGGGCYHGAIGSYALGIGTENLNQNLTDFCLNSDKSDQCMHGLGHGILAWNEYKLPLALDTCNEVTKEPMQQYECWRGVFMENVVGTHYPRELEDFSKYLSDDPAYPCTIYEGTYRDACEQFISFRIGALYRDDFRRSAKACEESVLPPFDRACFSSLGSNIAESYNSEIVANALCSWLTKEGVARDMCFYGANQRHQNND